MATVAAHSRESEIQGRLPWSVRFVLRAEALAVAVLTAIVYARTGASWWMFAGLWLAPDLSMLGYLAGPDLGARIYNSIHAYITPATLAACAWLLGAHGLIPASLIWANHIAVDRLLGYGLKFPRTFAWTHLGRVGKRETTLPA